MDPTQRPKNVLKLRTALVEPAAVVELRHRILRAGLPVETAVFDGDHEPTTFHLAAFDEWNMIVGCVTILQRAWLDRPAWQLRGMAVDDGWQGLGVGRLLLGESEIEVLRREYSLTMWCNARKIAVRFYEKHGWKLASPEFDIPTAGPHFRMTRKLAAEDD